MAVQSLSLYNDSSTLANFTAWASSISSWFATCGWVQTNDTGQVMWTGLTISACSASGGNSTYTYASLTGLALQNGRALTITGMTNAVNNGVFVITSFTGTTSGTFTVANASGVTESGSSGVVTKITSVPGNNGYVTEWWKPTDGGTPFVVRMQYGNNNGSSNCPNIGVAIADASSGFGVFQGNNAANGCSAGVYTIGGTGVQYDCRFSGDQSRIGIVMWRNAGNPAQAFGVERQRTSSGTIGTSHVTMWCAGYTNGSSQPLTQYTLVIGQGFPQYPSTLTGTGRNDEGAPAYLVGAGNTTNNYAVNGVVGISTLYPYVGYWDYPLTQFGIAPWVHFTEGQIFTASLYGSTRTYFVTGTGSISRTGPMTSQCWLLMRYD